MDTISVFERQREIYIRGFSGDKSSIPFQSDSLRAKARKYMSRTAWAYVDGAASDENTMQQNRKAFSDIAILPSMMHDNSTAGFSSDLFGTRLKFPFLLAPIGALDMIDKEADRMIAAACKNTSVPFVFSNQAGNPMEACAAAMGEAPHWFQLYWSKSDDLVLSFVKRAEDCGCKAIVLTVDTTLLGWRTRDLELGYLPFLWGLGIAQYTSDLVFQDYVKNGWGDGNQSNLKTRVTLQTIRNILKLKSNFKGTLKDAMASIKLFTQIYSNPALSWEKVTWLKLKTHLPVFIKGILRVDDALKARNSGADGIIVSNHGGRQVDGAISTVGALPEIRKALPKPFKILLDSGIRTGSDVFKAIALGADAVLLGRPYVYGLAIQKQKGVEVVIQNLQNDFELTARLSGCKSLQEINESYLFTR
jgi:lactate 2-monooxygenase